MTSFKSTLARFGTLLLSIGLFSSGAQAQIPRPVGTVTVPFAFRYGQRVLPAGSYTLRFESPSIMSVSSSRYISYASVLRDDMMNPSGRGRLVFLHDESGYRLTRFVSPERRMTISCIEYKAKAKRHEVASTAPEPSVTEVALLNDAH